MVATTDPAVPRSPALILISKITPSIGAVTVALCKFACASSRSIRAFFTRNSALCQLSRSAPLCNLAILAFASATFASASAISPAVGLSLSRLRSSCAFCAWLSAACRSASVVGLLASSNSACNRSYSMVAFCKAAASAVMPTSFCQATAS